MKREFVQKYFIFVGFTKKEHLDKIFITKLHIPQNKGYKLSYY
jgi:hypothetical protein